MHAVCDGLTLSANDDKRYLRDRPVHGKLVVEFINLLEAGLVFQAEDQDDSIHPARKLKPGNNLSKFYKFLLLNKFRSVSNLPELLGVQSPP